MSRKMISGSRSQRRAHTKSSVRKKVQTMTRGAAKRARKTMQGRSRFVALNPAEFEPMPSERAAFANSRLVSV